MTSRPTVGVLALQGDVREHLAALVSAGADAEPVRRPGELAAVDALVLPGGESTTMDKLLRAFGLFDPVRERIAAGMPVFGSCAGMILLADRVLDRPADQRTLGGIDMTVRRNAFGRQVDSFEQPLRAPGLEGGEGPLHAVFIRAPWVEEVGPGVEVLATTVAPAHAATVASANAGAGARSGPADGGAPGGTGRIVAVRHGRLLATAFHPEIGDDTRVHRFFVNMVREDAVAATQSST
ncbi:pyridoxal 5'-phosphate synthase glutaminase subunit PdxT [Georgenia sp. EYE_87]|uniref:pyridoxal 5'-phosphate synthase glutaminase subunit PdxT n=1 Tax=Georgenia sp. EYE_87 TaxID=2853448 RepID=UPI00200437FC|nr:pyridoxal 5'-phosphate synthase glutaminase subunit PdxT [Georgenia sp. EYE_87]MCK6209254.1 pyridoxal 5'-phosphate synthase glutaminase subunit PdxT [Georgenia sp. EYE_87]